MGLGIEINTLDMFLLNFVNSRGIGEGNFYLTQKANGVRENLDSASPLHENLTLKTMKKINTIYFIYFDNIFWNFSRF